MRRFRALSCAALLLSVEAGVGSACATTARSPPSPVGAVDYAPLHVGDWWEYRVTPGPDAPQRVRIVSFDKGWFVDDRGTRYAPRTDGLFDGTRFLLQEPLVVGHEWMAKVPHQGIERYRVVATDAVVTVPAGTFSPCIEVAGEQPARDPTTGKPVMLLMSWTWAKGVGLVRVQQRVQPEGAEPRVTALMELTTYSVSSSPSSASSSP